MGKTNPHINVSKGLPPDMLHLKPTRKRKRKGIRKRTIDEASVVSVERWPLPGAQHRYGVLSFYVSSCNVCSPQIGGDWDTRTAGEIADRLRENDGHAKGRVLYLVGEDWLNKATACAALTFHVHVRGP